MRDIVTTWFGTFVLDDGRVAAAYPAPSDRAALVDRARRRREGRLTPEEERALADHLARGLRARDRRLVASGASPGHLVPPDLDPREYGVDPGLLRDVLLDASEEAVRAGWDPSVHIEEAVRALSDLDAVKNLVGERLASWGARDAPPSAAGPDSPSATATRLLGPSPAGSAAAPSAPPAALAAARRTLAELFRSVEASQRALEESLTERLPEAAPNLTALLGPLLAARMLAQAGGLERMARLPASTIQVLGAERAFFEHLRGRAPPPRHGLLFLHPDIQGAPRARRGKLARALAGKVAIAARLDQDGRPVRPELAAQFRRRADEVRAMGPGRRKTGRSAPPLHRAADHR